MVAHCHVIGMVSEVDVRNRQAPFVFGFRQRHAVGFFCEISSPTIHMPAMFFVAVERGGEAAPPAAGLRKAAMNGRPREGFQLIPADETARGIERASSWMMPAIVVPRTCERACQRPHRPTRWCGACSSCRPCPRWPAVGEHCGGEVPAIGAGFQRNCPPRRPRALSEAEGCRPLSKYSTPVTLPASSWTMRATWA